MSRFHCSCGFAIDDASEFGDHLREVFTPRDDACADGRVHDEADHKYLCDAGTPPPTAFTCLCGFAADEAGELDDHFLLAVTPSDNIGIDGRKHVPVDTATPMRWGIR